MKSEIQKAIEFILRAIDEIGKIAGNAQVTNAYAAIKAVREIYKAVRDVTARRVKPEEAQMALDVLLSRIGQADAKADAKVDEKFGKR